MDNGMKRPRRVLQRKCVDATAPIISLVEGRCFRRDEGDLPSLQPHTTSIRKLLPPTAMRDHLASSMATRFCHTSVNKTRGPINCAVWTPEGRRLITGAATGELTLWNGTAYNFELVMQGHHNAVRAMEWSHNSKWLITADQGGLIKYWDAHMSNVHSMQGHSEPARDISFSPTDAKYVSCADDSTIRLWDFDRSLSGSPESELSGHGWDVKSVEWHPYQALIASGSKDNLVKLWDPKSGRCLHTMRGHKHTVLKVRDGSATEEAALQGGNNTTLRRRLHESLRAAASPPS